MCVSYTKDEWRNVYIEKINTLLTKLLNQVLIGPSIALSQKSAKSFCKGPDGK